MRAVRLANPKSITISDIYLDVIRPPLEGEEQQPGPIANGLHGSSGGFDPAQ